MCAVWKLSRLPTFPGEGAASILPVLYVRVHRRIGFKTLNQCAQCTRYGSTAHVRVRNTCGARQEFEKYACATAMVQSTFYKAHSTSEDEGRGLECKELKDRAYACSPTARLGGNRHMHYKGHITCQMWNASLYRCRSVHICRGHKD